MQLMFFLHTFIRLVSLNFRICYDSFLTGCCEWFSLLGSHFFFLMNFQIMVLKMLSFRRLAFNSWHSLGFALPLLLRAVMKLEARTVPPCTFQHWYWQQWQCISMPRCSCVCVPPPKLTYRIYPCTSFNRLCLYKSRIWDCSLCY